MGRKPGVALGRPLLTGQFRVKELHGPNLVANPGFEEGQPGQLPSGWSWQNRPQATAARMAVTAQEPHAGRQAMEMAGPGRRCQGQAATGVAGGHAQPAQPGETFLLTAWLRAKTPGTKAALTAQSYVAKVYYWAKEEPCVVGDQWQEYQLAFRLPAVGEKGYHAQLKDVRPRIDWSRRTGRCGSTT